VRLPIDLFREELLDSPRIVWPPNDLAEIRVRVQAFAPGADAPLFDSNRPGASAPFALSDLRAQLLAGETLRIRRLGTPSGAEVNLAGPLSLPGQPQLARSRPAPLLLSVVRRLAVGGDQEPLSARRIITTAVGDYEVLLNGDLRVVDQSVALAADRLL